MIDLYKSLTEYGLPGLVAVLAVFILIYLFLIVLLVVGIFVIVGIIIANTWYVFCLLIGHLRV